MCLSAFGRRRSTPLAAPPQQVLFGIGAYWESLVVLLPALDDLPWLAVAIVGVMELPREGEHGAFATISDDLLWLLLLPVVAVVRPDVTGDGLPRVVEDRAVVLPRHGDVLRESSAVPPHVLALRACCPVEALAGHPPEDACVDGHGLDSHQEVVLLLDLLGG